MSKKKPVSKEAILKQMMDLACRPVNDAVRLAYLNQEREEEISSLDLTALTEFKRNSNGTVEIKLTDRITVLEKLMEQLEETKEEGAAAFFRALEPTQYPEREVSQK